MSDFQSHTHKCVVIIIVLLFRLHRLKESIFKLVNTRTGFTLSGIQAQVTEQYLRRCVQHTLPSLSCRRKQQIKDYIYHTLRRLLKYNFLLCVMRLVGSYRQHMHWGYFLTYLWMCIVSYRQLPYSHAKCSHKRL